MLFISADPPAASRKLRRDLGLSILLIADEEHVTADHYGIAIAYRSPRAWVYPHGYIQPAVMAYAGERPLFHFVQRPSLLNGGGAFWRPSARRLLRILRQKLPRGAPRRKTSREF